MAEQAIIFIPEIDLKIVVYYELFSQDDGSTRLNFKVNWMCAALPPENKQGMMDAQATNLDLLKDVCENNPAYEKPDQMAPTLSQSVSFASGVSASITTLNVSARQPSSKWPP